MSKPIDERFKDYHEANPHVYDILVRYTREWVRKRRNRKLGIGMVWERMRWELSLDTDDPEGYKLNNDFRSRYARLIMEREPDLKDVFETRVLRSEEVS